MKRIEINFSDAQFIFWQTPSFRRLEMSNLTSYDFGYVDLVTHVVQGPSSEVIAHIPPGLGYHDINVSVPSATYPVWREWTSHLGLVKSWRLWSLCLRGQVTNVSYTPHQREICIKMFWLQALGGGYMIQRYKRMLWKITDIRATNPEINCRYLSQPIFPCLFPPQESLWAGHRWSANSTIYFTFFWAQQSHHLFFTHSWNFLLFRFSFSETENIAKIHLFLNHSDS